MAVSDPYCDVATYKAIVTKTDAGEDAEILDDLRAVSRYLDRRLGRFFTLDTADQARVYTPAPASVYQPTVARLAIDDLVTLVSITIDQNDDGTFGEAQLSATDYLLLPEDALVGPEPRPYTSILLTRWGTHFAFSYPQRVQVMGRWGWPAIPLAIQRATAHLTGILRLESPRATQRVSELGEMIGTSKEGQSIIRELANVYARRTVVLA